MRTRLAPTPSGYAHIGNAANFVLCWLFARAQGGEVVLRIENVDRARARPEFVNSLFADLAWLGLDWDLGPAGPEDHESPYVQSSSMRQARYREILEDWKTRELCYPCSCTRRDLALAAPQVQLLAEIPGFGRPYPGTCRHRHPGEAGPHDAWRLRLPQKPDAFDDLWQERQELSDLRECGDPVIARADGCFAYHLAVCADDLDQGITHVLRGEDLLPWSHLHRHIFGLLGGTPPAFGHHPLLGDAHGRRLSKSAGAESLAAMRRSGIRPEEVLGRLLPVLHPELKRCEDAISLSELLSLGAPFPANGRMKPSVSRESTKPSQRAGATADGD